MYQECYAETLVRDKSPSTIAWIGSVQVFFQFAAGSISGPITDRSGPRVGVAAYPVSV